MLILGRVLNSPLFTRLATLVVLLLSLVIVSASHGRTVRACNDSQCHWSVGGQAWTCLQNTSGPITNCVLSDGGGGGSQCTSGELCLP